MSMAYRPDYTIEVDERSFQHCPCCGNTDLYFGAMSSSSFGVQCLECGLRLIQETPIHYPSGVTNRTQLANYLLRRIAAKWNTRSHKPARVKDVERD